MRALSADPRPRLIVACDGAARGNPGPAGIGAHLTDETGRTVAEVAEGIGIATNNVAEYRAAIAGLVRARELGARTILLRSDSRLLIEQLAGRYKVRNAGLKPLHAEARRLIAGFDEVDLEHVPREFNVEADALANAGVDAWLAAGGVRPGRPDPGTPSSGAPR